MKDLEKTDAMHLEGCKCKGDSKQRDGKRGLEKGDNKYGEGKVKNKKCQSNLNQGKGCHDKLFQQS